MRRNLRISPTPLRTIALATGLVAAAPLPASAGFFDFLFGVFQPERQATQSSQPRSANTPATGGRFTAYCVRTCDGKYFPLPNRGTMTPAQMCQSFCPASTTKIFSGSNIETALGATGERYADLPNAFVYRKELKADCTCNGHDPAGLAPIDLSLDTTLRPGDIVATSDGLVAYTGNPATTGRSSEFTPIANYPGLTADVRAKLGEMKVRPAPDDSNLDDNEATSDVTGSLGPSASAAPSAMAASPGQDASLGR